MGKLRSTILGAIAALLAQALAQPALAQVPISGLPAAPNALPTDQHEVNQGGVSRRLTNAQIHDWLETVDWEFTGTVDFTGINVVFIPGGTPNPSECNEAIEEDSRVFIDTDADPPQVCTCDGLNGWVCGGENHDHNRIEEGDSSVEVNDLGTGHVIVTIDGGTRIDVALSTTTIENSLDAQGATTRIFNELVLEDRAWLYFRDDDLSNTVGFRAPLNLTANRDCTFEDDASPIPDSCVGDGVDDAGSGEHAHTIIEEDDNSVEVGSEGGGGAVVTIAGVPIIQVNSAETVIANNLEVDGDGNSVPEIVMDGTGLSVQSVGALRWMEPAGGNYFAFGVPAAFDVTTTCLLQNDGHPIPDGCVGDGVDDTGGGGTPGGADTQVQYNDAGAFGGDSGFTFNESTDDVTMAGALNLAATTNATGTNGVLYKGGSRFLHDFNYGNNGTVTTEGNNIFLGLNAGNFTTGATATTAAEASYNTGIGFNVMASTTTGSNNSAVGAQSLGSLTSGTGNVAVGVQSLYGTTIGTQNVALGGFSMPGNSSGSTNTAVGYLSLYYLASGNNGNTALGNTAGAVLADGSTANASATAGVYLGAYTEASASGNTNEVVIGYQAEGHGSNTVTLGNDSITDTYLKGTVTTNGDVVLGGLSHLQINGNSANDCISNGMENKLFYDTDCDDIQDVGEDDLSVDDTGGGAAVRDFVFPAYSLAALEHVANASPPLDFVAGTNVDVLSLGYDAATDECVGGTVVVPSDIDSAGTVEFRASWYSATATTNSVMWDIRHSGGQAEGVSWDTALTTVAAAADATQGTVKQITNTVWTATVSTLGWAADDVVNFELCRDANHASDTMAGDAGLLSFRIEVPLA